MEALPFKVHRRNPKVIYVGKDVEVPTPIREDRMGANALTYKGKIYSFQKNLPKSDLEHEEAHCRAEPSHVISNKGVVAWLEDEVRADLLTYKETGKPERIFDRLNSRASDARVYHLQDQGVSYNYYEQTKHALIHIEEVYRKYWDYLPDQWKKDYVKFMSYSGKKLERLRQEGKNCNPPKDYYVRWLKNGDYDVGKKRVVKGRDEITGFVVRKVK
jgi:hypothetical protein